MRQSKIVFTASLGALIVFAPQAEAHFQLVSPKNWWTMASDGSPQKTPPCGNEKTSGTVATAMVTAVQLGQSIPVQVAATIAHPGWYRISLKQGASSTQTTTSLPDPPTLGAAGSAKQCTPAFIDNPVWSPTQPVLADKLGLPAGSTDTNVTQSGTKTFNVTMPSNVTCTQASPCTLQVLMFMTDHPSGSCNYHHCADIRVATSPGDGGVSDAGTDALDDGGQGGSGMGPGTGGADGMGTGGAAGTTGSGTGGASSGGTGGTANGGNSSTGAGTGGVAAATGSGTGGTSSSGAGHAGTGGTGAGGTGTSSTGGGAQAGTNSGSSGGGGCSLGVSGPVAPRTLVMVLAFAFAFAFWRRRCKSR
ncbi:MAG: SCE4755 family polysaccharide monooxygenase-like protein [Polyangia bacterium]